MLAVERDTLLVPAQRPDAVSKQPEYILMPDAKVEVAVEEELRKPPIAREPVKVDEDWERRPDVNVERPETERVEPS